MTSFRDPVSAVTAAPEPAERVELEEWLGPFAREVRNPIASLVATADLLLDEMGPHDQHRGYARAIRDLSARLQESLNDMEALTSAAGTGHAVAVDVDALVRNQTDIMRPRIERQGVALSVVLPGRPVMVAMAEGALRLALCRILEHQAAAMPFGGALEIHLAVEPSGARLTSTDNGPNVPEERIETFFSPRFACPGRHGGVGLALARCLVERHGGAVTARNLSGGGVAIGLALPRTGPCENPVSMEGAHNDLR